MKRWPLQKAHFWEIAPFFRLLLPLIAGILLYPLWTGSNTVALFTAAFAYLLFIATAIFKTQNGLRQIATFFSLHCFLIFLAFSLCYFHDVRNSKHWFGHHVNTADLFLVRITGNPVQKESTWKLEVNVLQTLLPHSSSPSTGKAFVYLDAGKAPRLHKGDTLLIHNAWEPITTAGNPYEFNYALYCARNNIYFRSYLSAKDVLIKSKATVSDLTFTEAAHDRCMSILGEYINDYNTLGLVQSMLIGDEINLDPDLRETFADTGIIHVIAISGGNIAILFIIVLFLLRWIQHKKYHWLKYAIALPLVWFYVLMAGASPSAVRAALMFSLLAFGFMLQKRIDANSLNQLFATAFILLIANPMWLYAIGFQLSFIAVLSIILFYRHIYRWYTPTNKITKALWQTIAASISAETLIFPLVIYYFHTFPLLFIISNVVAYLLLGIVLILGMSVIAFSFIPFIAKFIAVVIAFLVRSFIAIISILSQLEPHSFQTLRLSAFDLLLVYLLITFVVLYLLHKKANAALLALATACILLASFCIHRYHDLHQERLVVYNAGKAMHIEYFNADTCNVLFTSGLHSPKKEYLLDPAHTQWQTRIEKQRTADLLRIANKKVLILKQAPLQTSDTLNIDEVILAYTPHITDLRQVAQTFHPQKLILSQTLSEQQLVDWLILSRKEGIHLRPVQNGAYILE